MERLEKRYKAMVKYNLKRGYQTDITFIEYCEDMMRLNKMEGGDIGYTLLDQTKGFTSDNVAYKMVASSKKKKKFKDVDADLSDQIETTTLVLEALAEEDKQGE